MGLSRIHLRMSSLRVNTNITRGLELKFIFCIFLSKDLSGAEENFNVISDFYTLEELSID